MLVQLFTGSVMLAVVAFVQQITYVILSADGNYLIGCNNLVVPRTTIIPAFRTCLLHKRITIAILAKLCKCQETLMSKDHVIKNSTYTFCLESSESWNGIITTITSYDNS